MGERRDAVAVGERHAGAGFDQKPDDLGVGRFVKIGIPAPQVMAPFVGVIEVVCGALIVLGLLTRFAAIALVIDMLVAFSTTKIPILLKSGFWAMAHEARTDYAMLLGAIFLMIVGAGRASIDARISSSVNKER